MTFDIIQILYLIQTKASLFAALSKQAVPHQALTFTLYLNT
jgi:hypothetical protein